MSTLKQSGTGGGAWDHGLPRGITMKSIFEEENPYLTPYNSANRNAWLNSRRSLPTDKNSPELSYWYETGKFPNYSSYVHDTQDLDDPTEGRANNADLKAWNQWRWNYQTEFEQNQAGNQSYQDLIDENNRGSTGGFTEQELIDAATDPTKTIVRDVDGNVISIDDVVASVNEEPVLGGALGEITNGTGTDTTEVVDTTGVADAASTLTELTNTDDTTEVVDTAGGGTLGEVTQTSAPGSSQGYNAFKEFVKDEVNQGYDESFSDQDVQDMQSGGTSPSGPLPVDGIYYNDAGEVIGFLTEADRANYNAAQNVNQNPTINIAGSLYDYDGNYVGADPNTINVGGNLYDRQGNYLGPAQAGATGETVGGASGDNVIFDPYTAEQEAASARAAEAVELMDAGYGRYNAAVRKLGIVGRQGEEYAPLILDQLRMAEQEAAQPQLAAFGFGLNPQLGGMPQIGVQGVQGNTGGQSALTSMSNAGLNQLQLAQQPYNRIALPAIDSATGQPDFSQVNNPTIFTASTDV